MTHGSFLYLRITPLPASTFLPSEAGNHCPFRYSRGLCQSVGDTLWGYPQKVNIVCLLAAGARKLTQVSGVKGRAALTEHLAVEAGSLGTLSRHAFWLLFTQRRAQAETGILNPTSRCERSVEICCLSTCGSLAGHHFLACMARMNHRRGSRGQFTSSFLCHFSSWELHRGPGAFWLHSILLGGWVQVSIHRETGQGIL